MIEAVTFFKLSFDDVKKGFNGGDLVLILASCISAFFISHVIYMLQYGIFNPIKLGEEFLIFFGFVIIFFLSFCLGTFFYRKFEKRFITRQFLTFAISFLGHRLFYGVDEAGTFFYNIMFIVPWLVLSKYILTDNKIQN